MKLLWVLNLPGQLSAASTTYPHNGFVVSITRASILSKSTCHRMVLLVNCNVPELHDKKHLH